MVRPDSPRSRWPLSPLILRAASRCVAHDDAAPVLSKLLKKPECRVSSHGQAVRAHAFVLLALSTETELYQAMVQEFS
eukprot:3574217-Prymnesium_polylepis.1